jgi:hypothetical protein
VDEEKTGNIYIESENLAGWLQENLAAIRTRHGLGETLGLMEDSGFLLEGVSADTWSYPVSPWIWRPEPV